MMDVYEYKLRVYQLYWECRCILARLCNWQNSRHFLLCFCRHILHQHLDFHSHRDYEQVDSKMEFLRKCTLVLVGMQNYIRHLMLCFCHRSFLLN